MANGENVSAAPAKKKRVKKLSTFNEEFDITLFLLIARRNLKWIAIIFASSILITVIYLRYSPHVFEESTTIQIGEENTANKVLGATSPLSQPQGDEMEEAIELMRSHLFMQMVFQKLPMQISYFNEGTFMNYELYPNPPYTVVADSNALQKLAEIKIYVHLSGPTSGQISYTKDGRNVVQAFTSGIGFSTADGVFTIKIIDYAGIELLQNKLKKDATFFCINDYSVLTKQYTPDINIKLLNPDAKTLQISCRDHNDKKACDIANTMASEYIRYDVEKRRKSSESVLNFINEQLGLVYNRIKITEDTLNKYQKDNNINSNSKEIIDANISRLSNVDEQITATELETKLMDDVERQVSTKKDVDPDELLSLINESDYAADLKDNVSTLRTYVKQRREALNTETPNNQTVIQLNGLIENEKKNLLGNLQIIQNKINQKMATLKDEAAKIQAPLEAMSSSNNVEYLRLQRLFSINDKYYDLLLAKKSEFEIAKAGYVPQTQVLENALPLWVVVSPRKSTSFAIGLLAAIAISIFMMLVVYLFYNNLTSVEEIERLSDCPATILGIVPLYTKSMPISQLIVNQNPKSLLAESFRSIRTNLQFIGTSPSESASTVIAITSTISGEGKTFVAINLAGIIAYSGKKVIILDLDMRKPRIHNALNLDNSKGMSTLLIGKYKLEEVVQKTETDNLHVITAGPIPPNPSELIISKPMDNLLDLLKQNYDVIIIDNPPVGLVTDGIAMLQRADYPIYVMRANYSKREFIHFVDRLYYENQLDKLSIILNGIDIKRQRYGYGYYGYGYTYGQGNYYEA